MVKTTLTNYAPLEPRPTAHIAVNKNRLKHYGNSVYLKDQQTFQIELFNPTQSTILACISINENEMPGGVILRPGERVFLERFLTENRKFVFNTYTVSGNSYEVERAIQNNGKILVKFYKESNAPITYYSEDHAYTYDFTIRTNTNIKYKNSFTGTVYNDLDFNTNCSDNKVLFKNTIETGRIEKGDISNQIFEFLNMSFDMFPFSITQINLLPISHKPFESSELRRKYCPACGTRVSKRTAKFCIECGKRL